MMADTPSAYPLAWPPGWPRTPYRQNGPYRTELPAALKNLTDQIRLLSGQTSAKSLVLSSNCTLGSHNPPDPGVVAYFVWDGQQIAIPCDRWTTVQQNVQAIALTIESMRAMERHGAKHMIKAMFQGFVALPHATAGQRPWWQVLGLPSASVTLAGAESAWREAMKTTHPDVGGSHEKAAALNAAIAEARKVLG